MKTEGRSQQTEEVQVLHALREKMEQETAKQE